ncbi:MAG: hypothetical protein J6C97_05140 [Clostridia bacterium]|nr:hypothetical protein [Clostridia bacterium]
MITKYYRALKNAGIFYLIAGIVFVICEIANFFLFRDLLEPNFFKYVWKHFFWFIIHFGVFFNGSVGILDNRSADVKNQKKYKQETIVLFFVTHPFFLALTTSVEKWSNVQLFSQPYGFNFYPIPMIVGHIFICIAVYWSRKVDFLQNVEMYEKKKEEKQIKKENNKKQKNKDLLENQQRQVKELLDNTGTNFFIKYYEILKVNSLLDIADSISESMEPKTKEKRILSAKKIFSLNLQIMALTSIVSNKSILHESVLAKAQKLLYLEKELQAKKELEKTNQFKAEKKQEYFELKCAYEDVKKEYFIKNAGNSGNKEQKGEDYKRELRGYLYKVGIVYFLKYYYDLKLKSVEEICNCITEKISLESKKNIANNAKKIFDAQLNIPILREIVRSKDFERVDVKKAEKILSQETYGIY